MDVYFGRAVLLTAALLFSSSAVLAETNDNDNDSATPYLSGVGIYKELSEDYYYGAIYSDYDGATADDLLSDSVTTRLVLRVAAKHLTQRRFNKLWSHALAINNSWADLEKYDDDIVSFSMLVKKRLLRGDEMVMTTRDGQFVAMINGATALTLDDPGFIHLLLRGWIGKHPPLQMFKRDLLGLSGNRSDDNLAQFDALVPQEGRSEEVASWFKPITPATEVVEVTAELTGDASEALVAGTSAVEETVAQDKARQQAEQKKLDEQKALAEQEQERLRQEEELRLAKERERLKAIQAESGRYLRTLISHANKFTTYPKRALRRNREGYVVVKAEVNREGQLVNSQIIEQARFTELNGAALKAVEKAVPFPVIPDIVEGETFEVSIPFRFALLN